MNKKVFFVEGFNDFLLIDEICKKYNINCSKIHEHKGGINIPKQTGKIRAFIQDLLAEIPKNTEVGVKIENGSDMVIKYITHKVIWSSLQSERNILFVFLFDEDDISKTEISKNYKIRTQDDLIRYLKNSLKLNLKKIGRNTYCYKNIYISITPDNLEKRVKDITNVDLHQIKDESQKREAIRKFIEFHLAKKNQWLSFLTNIITSIMENKS